MERLLVRPGEAAELLAVSRAVLNAMLERGELPCVEVGKRRLVPLSALREWVVARVKLAESEG